MPKVVYVIILLFSTLVAGPTFSAPIDESPIETDVIAEALVNGEELEIEVDIYDDDFYRQIMDKSLFFNIADIKKMMWIVDSIKSGIRLTEEDILGEEAVNKLNLRAKSSISFHLDSLLYIDEDSWSVWLNGKPVISKQNERDIEILEITPDFVKLVWSTGYSKFVNSIRYYIEKKIDDSRIRAEIKDGIATVVFTLEPNQSFSITDNVTIIEGTK